jgi:mRNA-degrading endonuclease toxin of MazEF toxin-antitoxin module
MVPLDPRTDRVPRSSVVSIDNIQSIPVAWLDELIVRLRSGKMRAIEEAIHFALDLSY